MIIERNSNQVIFRISKKVKLDDLQEMVDWIEFKEISSKSKASQKEVDEWVKTMKKGRWKKTKSKVNL